MRITKLKIRDFRGIEAMDINAGDINLFTGQNAQGKTGVLDAIKAAMVGKVPPEAIRHDADRAEILLEIDGDTTIHRKIPAGGKQTVTVKKDSATLSSPQAWLDSLFSAEGLNPVEFIKSKDRQKRLLEALPVTTTPAEVVELLESVGLSKSDLAGLRTDSAHAFEVFTKVAKALADDRKGVNAKVKQADQWIKAEREELAGATDPSEEIAELTGKLAEVKAAAGQRAEKAARLEKMETRRIHLAESIEEIRSRLEGLDLELRDVTKEIGETAAEVDGASNAASDAKQLAEMGAHLAELQETKGAWDEMQRRTGRIEAKEADLAELKKRKAGLDAGVKLFQKDAPAMALARTPLPVDGLEYKDGAFFVHGTHIDQLSAAETTRVAVQFTLERVRKKGLHVVCVDGIELLDDTQRDQFFSEMADSEIQLWATEVDHGAGRGAPDGDGVLYVVMQNGAPMATADTTQPKPEPIDSNQAGLSF